MSISQPDLPLPGSAEYDIESPLVTRDMIQHWVDSSALRMRRWAAETEDEKYDQLIEQLNHKIQTLCPLEAKRCPDLLRFEKEIGQHIDGVCAELQMQGTEESLQLAKVFSYSFEELVFYVRRIFNRELPPESTSMKRVDLVKAVISYTQEIESVDTSQFGEANKGFDPISSAKEIGDNLECRIERDCPEIIQSVDDLQPMEDFMREWQEVTPSEMGTVFMQRYVQCIERKAQTMIAELRRRIIRQEINDQQLMISLDQMTVDEGGAIATVIETPDGSQVEQRSMHIDWLQRQVEEALVAAEQKSLALFPLIDNPRTTKAKKRKRLRDSIQTGFPAMRSTINERLPHLCPNISVDVNQLRPFFDYLDSEIELIGRHMFGEKAGAHYAQTTKIQGVLREVCNAAEKHVQDFFESDDHADFLPSTIDKKLVCRNIQNIEAILEIPLGPIQAMMTPHHKKAISDFSLRVSTLAREELPNEITHWEQLENLHTKIYEAILQFEQQLSEHESEGDGNANANATLSVAVPTAINVLFKDISSLACLEGDQPNFIFLRRDDIVDIIHELDAEEEVNQLSVSPGVEQELTTASGNVFTDFSAHITSLVNNLTVLNKERTQQFFADMSAAEESLYAAIRTISDADAADKLIHKLIHCYTVRGQRLREKIDKAVRSEGDFSKRKIDVRKSRAQVIYAVNSISLAHQACTSAIDVSGTMSPEAYSQLVSRKNAVDAKETQLFDVLPDPVDIRSLKVLVSELRSIMEERIVIVSPHTEERQLQEIQEKDAQQREALEKLGRDLFGEDAWNNYVEPVTIPREVIEQHFEEVLKASRQPGSPFINITPGSDGSGMLKQSFALMQRTYVEKLPSAIDLPTAAAVIRDLRSFLYEMEAQPTLSKARMSRRGIQEIEDFIDALQFEFEAAFDAGPPASAVVSNQQDEGDMPAPEENEGTVTVPKSALQILINDSDRELGTVLRDTKIASRIQRVQNDGSQVQHMTLFENGFARLEQEWRAISDTVTRTACEEFLEKVNSIVSEGAAHLDQLTDRRLAKILKRNAVRSMKNMEQGMLRMFDATEALQQLDVVNDMSTDSDHDAQVSPETRSAPVTLTHREYMEIYVEKHSEKPANIQEVVKQITRKLKNHPRKEEYILYNTRCAQRTTHHIETAPAAITREQLLEITQRMRAEWDDFEEFATELLGKKIAKVLIKDSIGSIDVFEAAALERFDEMERLQNIQDESKKVAAILMHESTVAEIIDQWTMSEKYTDKDERMARKLSREVGDGPRREELGHILQGCTNRQTAIITQMMSAPTSRSQFMRYVDKIQSGWMPYHKCVTEVASEKLSSAMHESFEQNFNELRELAIAWFDEQEAVQATNTEEELQAVVRMPYAESLLIYERMQSETPDSLLQLRKKMTKATRNHPRLAEFNALNVGCAKRTGAILNELPRNFSRAEFLAMVPKMKGAWDGFYELAEEVVGPKLGHAFIDETYGAIDKYAEEICAWFDEKEAVQASERKPDILMPADILKSTLKIWGDSRRSDDKLAMLRRKLLRKISNHPRKSEVTDVYKACATRHNTALNTFGMHDSSKERILRNLRDSTSIWNPFIQVVSETAGPKVASGLEKSFATFYKNLEQEICAWFDEEEKRIAQQSAKEDERSPVTIKSGTPSVMYSEISDKHTSMGKPKNAYRLAKRKGQEPTVETLYNQYAAAIDAVWDTTRGVYTEEECISQIKQMRSIRDTLETNLKSHSIENRVTRIIVETVDDIIDEYEKEIGLYFRRKKSGGSSHAIRITAPAEKETKPSRPHKTPRKKAAASQKPRYPVPALIRQPDLHQRLEALNTRLQHAEDFHVSHVDQIFASVQSHFLAQCVIAEGFVENEEERESATVDIKLIVSQLTARLQEAVRTLCKRTAPQLPQFDELQEELATVITEFELERELPATIKKIFDEHVLTQLFDALSRENDAISFYTKVPYTKLEGDVSPIEKIERLPIKTKAESLSNEQAIDNCRIQIIAGYTTNILRNIISDTPKSVIDLGGGREEVVVSSRDISCQWITTIQGAIQEAVDNYVESNPQNAVSTEEYVQNIFSDTRQRILFARACSNAERKLKRLPKDITPPAAMFTHMRKGSASVAIQTQESASLLSRNAIESFIASELLDNRTPATPLLPQERESLEQFCSNVLQSGEDVETRMKSQLNQLKKLAREFNHSFHAGLSIRNTAPGKKGSLWDAALAIGARTVLQQQKKADETGRLEQLANHLLPPHIRTLEEAVSLNDEWIDTWPTTQKEEDDLLGFGQIRQWHERSKQYVSHYRTYAEEITRFEEARLNAESVTMARTRRVVYVQDGSVSRKTGRKGKSTLRVNRRKVRAFLNDREAKQNFLGTSTNDSAQSAHPESHALLSTLWELSKEMQQLEQDLAENNAAVNSPTSVQSQLAAIREEHAFTRELRTENEDYIRRQQSFIESAPSFAQELYSMAIALRTVSAGNEENVRTALAEAQKTETDARKKLQDYTVSGGRDHAQLTTISEDLEQAAEKVASLQEELRLYSAEQQQAISQLEQSILESAALLDISDLSATASGTITFDELQKKVHEFCDLCGRIHKSKEELNGLVSQEEALRARQETLQQELETVEAENGDHSAANDRLAQLKETLEHVGKALSRYNSK